MPIKQKPKILVADDSAFMRQYIIGYLHEAGFDNITEAANGKMALEAFDRQKPDIVLLDLIMPVEDGISVLDKLAKKNAKVIVISAIGQKAILEKTQKIGAKGYFIKPFFDSKEIKNKIEEVLASQ